MKKEVSSPEPLYVVIVSQKPQISAKSKLGLIKLANKKDKIGAI
jgi:hypothetical protein